MPIVALAVATGRIRATDYPRYVTSLGILPAMLGSQLMATSERIRLRERQTGGSVPYTGGACRS
jgi:hypothetical protein